MARVDMVYLTQVDERHAPAEQPVLGVSAVEDEVFLTIAKYEETADMGTYTTLKQVSVDLDGLLLALEAVTGIHLVIWPTQPDQGE